MKVIPYPDRWMSYKPLPEMQGKCLGIFAHIIVRNGEQKAIRDVYRNIVDVATEEETCIVLSGSQSLVMPNHNLLYEEWTDYDEFFEVQMGRPYRKAFLRWYDPLREGIVSPEFTEMFYSSGKHPFNVAFNAYALVQSVHVSIGREDNARRLFMQYIDDVGRDEINLVANIHQSINNPQHFLLYEIWSDFSHLIENELSGDRRSDLEARFNALKDDAMPEPAMELLQVFYDADKYVHPTE
jgi:quinol monooxygenase YgiN